MTDQRDPFQKLSDLQEGISASFSPSEVTHLLETTGLEHGNIFKEFAKALMDKEVPMATCQALGERLCCCGAVLQDVYMLLVAVSLKGRNQQ
jgi:hypothetical protein